MNLDSSPIDTLITILNMNFPDISTDILINDELYSLTAPIHFPSFSITEWSLIVSNSQKFETFADVLSGSGYYFPLVPIILQLISEIYEPSQEIINYYSKFVIMSYVTWRLFVEYTTNFESLPLLLNSFIFSSYSSYFELIMTIFNQSITFYINSVPSFDIILFLHSLENMIISNPRSIIYVQHLFQPILEKLFVRSPDLVSNDLIEFFVFIKRIDEDALPSLDITVATNIIDLVSGLVYSLNFEPFCVTNKLTPFAEKKKVQEIVLNIPQYILEFIIKSDIFIQMDSSKELQLLQADVISRSELSNALFERKTFTDHVIPELVMIYEKPKSHGHLLPESLKTVLDEYYEMIVYSGVSFDTLIQSFFELCGKLSNSHQAELIYIITYISSYFELSKDTIDSYFKIVINSSLFCQGPIIDSNGNICENASIARSESVLILEQSCFLGFPKAIEYSLEKPLIFSEIIIRVVSFYETIPSIIITDKYFIRLLSNAWTLFQRLHISSKGMQREIIEATRMSLIVFIHRSLQDDTVTHEWFSNQVFLSLFIAMMFEYPLRSFVSNHLHSYIHDNSEGFSAQFISSFVSVNELLMMHFPDIEHIVLAKELLELSNKIIEKQNKLTDNFRELLDCIFCSYPGLDDTDASHLFLIESLHFFYFFSEAEPIDLKRSDILLSTLLRLDFSEHYDKVFVSLFDLFCPTKEPRIIKSIILFPVLYKFCLKRGCLVGFLKDCLCILSQSTTNCRISQRGLVDIFLIDEISGHKEDTIEDSSVQLMFNLICLISPKFSSPTFVKKFVSFLCDKPNKSLTIYYFCALETLQTLFYNHVEFCDYFIPLGQNESPLEISGIPSTLFEKNFFISFRILPDFRNAIIRLFDFSDSKGKSFGVSLIRGDLLFDYNYNNNPQQISMQTKITEMRWNKVEIFFRVKNSQVSVNARINCKDGPKIKATWSNFSGLLRISFGSCSNQTAIPSYYMSSIRMQSSELKTILNIDFRKPTISKLPSISSDVIDPRFLVTCISIDHSVDFVECLVSVIQIKSLMILFKNHIFQNTCIIPFIIDLLITLFHENEKAQNAFLESRLSGVVSYLLSTTKEEFLTYELYLKLVSLLNPIVIEKLKSNIMKRLILEFSIWERASPSTLCQITSHWVQSLIPVFQNEFSRYISVNTLLVILRKHVFESKNDTSLESRLVTLIIETAKLSFSSKSLLFFIGHCLICSELEQIKLNIFLLKTILGNMNTTNPQSFKNGNYIALLHNLFGYNDPGLFVDIVRIIVLSHKKGIISGISLEQHLEVIMNDISPSFVTSFVFEQLLSLILSGISELMSLSCLIAINLGVSYVDRLIDIVNLGKTSWKNHKDLFWGIIMFGQCGEIRRQDLFCYLFGNNKLNLSVVFSMIHIVQIILSIDPNFLMHIFLSDLINMIEQDFISLDTETVYSILRETYINIFFQPSIIVTNWISQFFKDSPFKRVAIHRYSIESILNFHILSKRIEGIMNSKLNVSFSIRMSSVGTWSDSDIALRSMILLEKLNDPGLLLYDIVACSFLVRSNPKEVENHINAIGFKTISTKLSSYIINYLSYQCMSCGCNLNDFPLSSPIIASFVELEQIIQIFPSESSPRSISKILYSAWDSILGIEKAFLSLTNDGIAESSLKGIELISNSILLRQNHCENLWQKLWKDMTQPLGPWENCIDPNDIFLSRSHTLTYFGIPSKTKWKHPSQIKTDVQLHNKPANNIRYQCIQTTPVFNLSSSLEICDNSLRISNGYKELKIIFADILVVMQKSRFSELNSIEIHTTLHKLYSLTFSPLIAFNVYSQLALLSKNGSVVFLTVENQTSSITTLAQKWNNGIISNFDYLLSLNYISGRTFYCSIHYPVFPWVLSDYSTDSLDNSCFRDFSQNTCQLSSPLRPSQVMNWISRLYPYYANKTSQNVFDSVRSLNSKDLKNQEIIPEFYFCPEALMANGSYENVELPIWADDPFHFVYIHRRALESPAISKQLNLWIDSVWGVNQKSNYQTSFDPIIKLEDRNAFIIHHGSIPTQLFTKPHIEKKNLNESKTLKANGFRIIAFSDQSISYSTFYSHDKTTINGLIVTKTGKINLINLKVTALISTVTSQIGNINNQNEDTILDIGVMVSNNCFLSVNSERNQLELYYSDGKIQLSEVQSFKFSKIECDDKWIITYNNHSQMHIWNRDRLSSPSAVFTTTFKLVNFIALSSKFDLIVFGTENHQLFFCSLYKNRVSKMIPFTNGSIKRIIVTPTWGFVLVFSEIISNKGLFYEISLFSPNSHQIRSETISEKITCWDSFSSPNGFDFIIAATEKGNIYVFEAFFLKLGTPLFSGQLVLNSISYIKDNSIAVGTHNRGRIVLYNIHLE